MAFSTLLFQYLPTLALIWLVYFLYKYQTYYKRLPPGPWGIPIFGYLLFLNPKDTYLQFHEMTKKYGPIYSLQMGKIFTVIVSDANIIKEAFSKDVFNGRSELYVTHGIMEGYGLICADGHVWKNQRKFVIRCLNNFGMVKLPGPKRDLMEMRIYKGVKTFLTMIKDTKSCGTDPHHILLHTVGNIINDIVFGRTWEENDPKWKWLLSLAEEGIKHVGVSGPVNFLPFLRFIPKYKRVMRYLIDGKVATHKYYQQIIDEHDPLKDDDIIAAYLKEMKKNPDMYSLKQLYHLMADIFGAGLDTTTILMRWFIMLIALHPEIQEQVRDEIISFVQPNEEITLDHISKMEYLQATINETHRIRTVVTLGIPHSPKEDTYIGKYFIPKGTMVIPFLHSVHMKEDHYDNPQEFRPSRFLNKKSNQFIPFSIGKRMCMGGELSRMISTLFLSNLIRRYRVTYESKEEVLTAFQGEFGITLQPGHNKLIFLPLDPI